MQFPQWAQAGLWGLLAGSALLVGAAVGVFARVPPRTIAWIMAFGAGVLISALAFELVEEAHRMGGLAATIIGFLGGAGVYTFANHLLNQQGAKHRKRSGEEHPDADSANGLALALGALLDGIPESIVIGVGLIGGAGVSWVTVVAIFLSNLPEGLSSAAGMKRAGHSPAYIFGVWGAIALASGIAALVGNAVFGGFPKEVIAGTNAVAAGAVLAMLFDTMIPEAFEEGHDFTGFIAALGFLTAFALSMLGHRP